MDYETTEALRERHAAWRLLRAANASLVLSFLGRFFVEGNRGPTAAADVAAALEDDLYALNRGSGAEDQRFPKAARAYLDDWSATDVGFLRRFYPAGDDEVHYEVTPAFEKSFAWVESLQARAFVGTESRLHTVVDLLRQIVHGSETDPQARLDELHRQRADIDEQIRQVEAGVVTTLDPTGVRDRYQQAAGVARELLADFRQVEENFRDLDRGAREKIASWGGSKGELLDDLVGGRASIATSDQGRSFQAFHDFLLSEARQDELARLLDAVQRLDAVEADSRFRTVHHDWSEAAERTQRTVRQISEQLRRFLDEQVWLENRRVVDLVRIVEAAALEVRGRPPALGLEVDEPGIEIALPFERPLYDARPVTEVDSLLPPAAAEELTTGVMFAQTFIDQARLAANIRALVPERSAARLEDILEWYPIEQGAAEVVGYLALQDNDIEIDMDDTDETIIEWQVEDGTTRRARLPQVTVRTPMSDERAVAVAIIRLMQGVVYREADEDTWLTLERRGAGVRDHFATIGVDVVTDEVEGFAYLRTRSEVEGEVPLPRLVRRRSLTYNVSLLLVLLRKRLVEFETSGSEGRLVLSRPQMVELLRLFLAGSTNEARAVDTADATIRKAAELGFLRQLRGQPDHWEVRRILKAYVDAESLSSFASKLQEYAGAMDE